MAHPNYPNARINAEGFLERKIRGSIVPHGASSTYRDWYLVKSNRGNRNPIIYLPKHVVMPKEYFGKKIRFKLGFFDPIKAARILKEKLEKERKDWRERTKALAFMQRWEPRIKHLMAEKKMLIKRVRALTKIINKKI